jgi:hypothetical protein
VRFVRPGQAFRLGEKVMVHVRALEEGGVDDPFIGEHGSTRTSPTPLASRPSDTTHQTARDVATPRSAPVATVATIINVAVADTSIVKKEKNPGECLENAIEIDDSDDNVGDEDLDVKPPAEDGRARHNQSVGCNSKPTPTVPKSKGGKSKSKISKYKISKYNGARLKVTTGPYTGKEYYLGNKEGFAKKIVFGTNPSRLTRDATFVNLPHDEKMEKTHAVFEWIEWAHLHKFDLIKIRVFGKEGDTFLEGRHITNGSKKHEALCRDKIQMGDTIIEVYKAELE